MLTESASTGIHVRDRHMHEQILAPAGPITITLRLIPKLEEKAAATTVFVRVQWNGVQRIIPVKVHLHAGKLDIDGEFNLRDFGLSPPRFLNLTVAPDIKIRGRMAVTK